jgi:hypothetical protein
MRHSLSLRGGAVAVWPLQLGSVVLPLLLMVVAGVWLWRVEYRIAAETVRRNAAIVAEYSLRVLSAQDQLLRNADAFATPARVQFERPAIREHFTELTAKMILRSHQPLQKRRHPHTAAPGGCSRSRSFLG